MQTIPAGQVQKQQDLMPVFPHVEHQLVLKQFRRITTLAEEFQTIMLLAGQEQQQDIVQVPGVLIMEPMLHEVLTRIQEEV